MLLSTLDRDRFAKVEGGLAGSRRGMGLVLCMLIQVVSVNVTIHADMRGHEHKCLM